MLFQYLQDVYGVNAPIPISSIRYKSYSAPWIAKEVKALCDEGKLARYEKGIYYIPTETLFGASVLTPQSVIAAKYLSKNGETIGYYTGYTLLNSIGFTTQVPRVTEVCTNSEASAGREALIGGVSKVYLRHPKEPVCDKNVWALALMDIMDITNIEEYTEEKLQILKRFVFENEIVQKEIFRVAGLYSGHASKTLVGSVVLAFVPTQ